MSFLVPCAAAFWFGSGAVKVLVLSDYLGLQPFLCLGSIFLLKEVKDLHVKEQDKAESRVISTGSLGELPFGSSVEGRSQWQYRLFTLMVLPLVRDVFEPPGSARWVCPPCDALLGTIPGAAEQPSPPSNRLRVRSSPVTESTEVKVVVMVKHGAYWCQNSCYSGNITKNSFTSSSHLIFIIPRRILF